MPDNRPIGVFDSGVGGLTVLRELHALLPRESTIYLGDLARCPYGPRPQEDVRQFALEVSDFLGEQGIKLLVVACNTATAAAYLDLRDRYPFPVIGVIAPGAAEASRSSASGRIGVVATDGTVASGAYSAAIASFRPDATVVERPASWLVPLIEAGDISDEVIQERLAPVLDEMRDMHVDTVILGCTHFPLLRHLFEAGIGPEVRLLDSATTTSREVARQLHQIDIEATAVPSRRILVTGPSAAFAVRAETMFHQSPTIEAVEFLAPSA